MKTAGFDPVIPSARLSVARADGEYHVFAVRPFAPGEVLLAIDGEQRERPSRHSLQVGWGVHIEAGPDIDLETLMDRYSWRFLNHSCDGNTAVRGCELVAIRHIRAGTEVTFNYNTTEYDMACPFTCHCGSLLCAGEIHGFKHLSRAEQQRLRPLLSEHLRSLLDQIPDGLPQPVLT
jgi:hypothetical protein